MKIKITFTILLGFFAAVSLMKVFNVWVFTIDNPANDGMLAAIGIGGIWAIWTYNKHKSDNKESDK